MRSRRAVRGSARALVTGLVVAVGAAGGPQPPALPSGIGMQWVRDLGGSTDEFGNYHEAYSRFTLLNGVRSGPTALPPSYLPLTPLLGPAYASFEVPVFPDGTARFPWNGFA